MRMQTSGIILCKCRLPIPRRPLRRLPEHSLSIHSANWPHPRPPVRCRVSPSLVWSLELPTRQLLGTYITETRPGFPNSPKPQPYLETHKTEILPPSWFVLQSETPAP